MAIRAPIHPRNLNRQRQRGVAMVALVLLIMVTFGFFGLRNLNNSQRQTVLKDDAEAMLARTKEALIATSLAMGPGVSSPGRLPFPDVWTGATSGDISGRDYDGTRDNNCARQQWVSGTALPTTLTLTARCVGRLPWRDVGLQMDNVPDDNDPDGVMPWFAFGARLSANGCTEVNSKLLNNNATCAQAWPWITVVDAKGNVLTNRAAVVIMIPGPQLGTQNRTTSATLDSTAYLDSVTVQAGCTAPCIPGTYNNGRRWDTALSAAADNARGMVFIQCADISTVSPNNPNYAQPYNCNDKLTYITIDEWIAMVEKRALAEAKQQLNAFYATNGYFPYAAPLGSIDCVTGQRYGHLPGGNAAVRCPGGGASFTTQSWATTWFDINNWADVIYYDVAPGCIQSASLPRCTSSLLTVGTQTTVRSLLIAAGRPIASIASQVPAITTPPYAASRGADQTGYPSGTVSNYLDSVRNATGYTTLVYDAVNTARTSIYNDQLLIVAP